MKYYIMQNKIVPWGDYGEVLFRGFLNVMDENYNDIEVPELERVAPYVPEIYIANSIDIILSDTVKNIIVQASIRGIVNFRKTKKRKIVNINWTEWDMACETPLIYPKSGAPENYILKGKHSEETAELIPDMWNLVVEHTHKLEKLSDKIDSTYYSDIAIQGNPEKDIFIPFNMLFVVVSEIFKNLMELNNIDTIRFVELQQI